MKKMQRIAAVLAAVCLVMSAAGCSSSEGDANVPRNISISSDSVGVSGAEKQVISDLLDACTISDMGKFVSLTFPKEGNEKLSLTMSALSGTAKLLFGDELAAVDSIADLDVHDHSVEKELDSNELKLYNQFLTMYSELLNEGGIFQGEDISAVKGSYDISWARVIKVSASYMGEPVLEDVPFLVYKVNGEDLKADTIVYPTMVGYIEKNAQNEADNAANSLDKAVNAALVDMENNGKLPTDAVFILDSEYKYVPDGFDRAEFEKLLAEYIDMPDYRWFAVCDRFASYIVLEYEDEFADSAKVGTYPRGELLETNIDEYFGEAERYVYSYTYDDVLDACKKELGL